MTARLRVSEAAQLAGVSASTLRAWESSGLIKPSRSGRYRWFSPRDVKDLQEIASLRARGFNVAAIRSMRQASDRASAWTDGASRPPGTAAEPEQPLGEKLRAARQPGGVAKAQPATVAGGAQLLAE